MEKLIVIDRQYYLAFETALEKKGVFDFAYYNKDDMFTSPFCKIIAYSISDEFFQKGLEAKREVVPIIQ